MGLFSSTPLTQQKLNKKICSALYNREYDTLRKLLEEPVLDLNTFDSNDHCALRIAVDRCDVDIIELLIEKGADISVADQDPDRPLMYKAVGNRYEVVQKMISLGLDVNVPAARGETPLHRAGAAGYDNIVRLLLENGADPNILDNNLGNAADAADVRHPRIADRIRRHKSFSSHPVSNEWKLTGDREITHIYEKKEAGFVMTDIFDFNLQTYINVVFNERAKTQSHVTRSFSELAETGLVDEAAAEMKKQGIDIPSNAYRFGK